MWWWFVAKVTIVLLYRAQAISCLSDTKEIDRVKTDEWVENFYDQCGRTRNFNEAEENTFGNYNGLEVTKTCTGDRDKCIEERNCYFAVAIEETFKFDKEYEVPSTTTEPIPSSIPPPLFVRYIKTIIKVDVTLLDTCHLYPLPNEQTQSDKFVGLSFGTLQNGKLRCNDFQLHYDITDFRAFFYVKDFSQCNIQLDIPVHPIYKINGLGNDKITNFISINPQTWDEVCKNITDTIPDSVSFENNVNQDFMKYLTLIYYGTTAYTNLDVDPKNSNFSYADEQNFADNSRGIVRLGPKADKRKINEPPTNTGITFDMNILSCTVVSILIFHFS